MSYFTTKKQVHYTPSPEDAIVEGYPAVVFPKDHPDNLRVSNSKYVITSRVLKLYSNGEFETENTHYIPA